MKKLILLLITILFAITTFAQTITGKVFDIDTKAPLAFANLSFDGNPKFNSGITTTNTRAIVWVLVFILMKNSPKIGCLEVF